MTEQPEGTRAVVCRVGRHRFALAGDAVREVCTDLQLVRMPGVAAPVEGVFNLRGTLVTVVRAAGTFADGSGDPGPSAWCVVVQYRDGRVGFGVDEVIDFAATGPEVPMVDVEAALEPVFRRG